MSVGKIPDRSNRNLNRHDEALEVLLILRRRLLERLSKSIVQNRETLLNGASKTSNPLSTSGDLADMIRNLGDIDRAVLGLAELSASNGEYSVTSKDQESCPQEMGVFSRFVELIRKSRLEEASQELSRTLQIPLDRVITATRFFTRNLKTDPTLPRQLGALWSTVTEMSEAEASKTMMRLFGFQSVESRIAVHTLWARARAATGVSPETPIMPVGPGRPR